MACRSKNGNGNIASSRTCEKAKCSIEREGQIHDQVAPNAASEAETSTTTKNAHSQNELHKKMLSKAPCSSSTTKVAKTCKPPIVLRE